ncbi:MAG: peptidoglycan DD-metalloendopeptidase family protein [Nitrospirae bacterium]|nr:peptidoglycan DD-metalloendopeptidase family protein [Nitrospirota bacterium]
MKGSAMSTESMSKVGCSVLISVFFICCFGSTAFSATIPKLAKPSSSYSTSNINLKFGGDWTTFAGQCTKYTTKPYLTWYHTGIDIKASKGSDVYAAESGVVKVSQDSGTKWKEWIAIEHKDSKGNKYTTNYWHLKNRKVNVGKNITRGSKIAEVADMGLNTHLHFGLYNKAYENTANRGGLPQNNTCSGYPAYKDSFVNPVDYLP